MKMKFIFMSLFALIMMVAFAVAGTMPAMPAAGDELALSEISVVPQVEAPVLTFTTLAVAQPLAGEMSPEYMTELEIVQSTVYGGPFGTDSAFGGAATYFCYHAMSTKDTGRNIIKLDDDHQTYFIKEGLFTCNIEPRSGGDRASA